MKSKIIQYRIREVWKRDSTQKPTPVYYVEKLVAPFIGMPYWTGYEMIMNIIWTQFGTKKEAEEFLSNMQTPLPDEKVIKTVDLGW